MTYAFIEDPRVTAYRRKLAELLRRTSCRWISFAFGTAPIHRTFFENVAVAIEGLPIGEAAPEDSGHRPVQYGVRLRIATLEGESATYDAGWDTLVVPAERAFGSVDGQATLVSACVHLGLDLEGRNRRQPDSECAARIAGHLYRLYETVSLGDSQKTLGEKLRRLTPASPGDEPFFDVAADIVHHCRATLRANRRSNPVRPGSFMKIVPTERCERLRRLLSAAAALRGPAGEHGRSVLPRPSRFLALQALPPHALQL